MRGLGKYYLDKKLPFGFGKAKIKTGKSLWSSPLARCDESFHLFSLERETDMPPEEPCTLQDHSPRREVTLCLWPCFVAPNDNFLYRHTLKQTNCFKHLSHKTQRDLALEQGWGVQGLTDSCFLDSWRETNACSCACLSLGLDQGRAVTSRFGVIIIKIKSNGFLLCDLSLTLTNC